MDSLKNIAVKLAAVQCSIEEAAQQAAICADNIQLVAVSKKQPIAALAAAYAAGQRHFGENYLQEALPKIEALAAYQDISWHFIGHIQRNKTRCLAEHFHWVQTVCDEAIARRLHEQRPTPLPPLNICLQVNAYGETNKSGMAPEHVLALAEKIVTNYPRLRLRGLMAIPPKEDSNEKQLANFHVLQHLFLQLQQQGLALDTLSMGMSADLSAAVAAGSTMVRVGASIFGQR